MSGITAKRFVVRVDSSEQIGSGHVMRCLTLANALSTLGGEVLFLCRDLQGNLIDLIAQQGYEVIRLSVPSAKSIDFTWCQHANWLEVDWELDARETRQILQQRGGCDWLIVDHYALGRSWETSLKGSYGQLMVVDDLADRPHDCDLLLDQNLYANMQERYEGLVPKGCRQLLGPKYALLREEFSRARKRLPSPPDEVRRLLVFFGNADPGDETGKVLQVLSLPRYSHLTVDVVVGAMNPRRDRIRDLCAGHEHLKFHCQVNNLAELMVSADLAVAAGGATTWERCCLGLPSLVVSVALNQQELSRHGAESGLFHYLGGAEEVSCEDYAAALATFTSKAENLRGFSTRGKELVDGQGASRVCVAMSPLAIQLRPAVEGDCEAIYTWRNAEDTRRYIFDARPIPLETHRQWYQRAMENPDRILLIGELDGKAVGVLRYDVTGDEAMVSIFLVPGTSGKGVGTQLIRAGSTWLAKHRSEVFIINAEILGENLASQIAFARAGYRLYYLTYREERS